MPKIPIYYSERLPPGKTSRVAPSLGAVGLEAEALGIAGRQIQQTAEYAGRIFGKIAEENANQIAIIKAEEIENIVDEEANNIAESFKNRTDWDEFDYNKHINNEIERIRNKTRSKLRVSGFEGGGYTSQKLQAANEKILTHYSKELRKIAILKQGEFVKNKSKIEFDKIYEKDLENFVGTDDPNQKSLIRNKLEIKSLVVGEYGSQRMVKFDEDVIKKLSAQATMEIIKGGGGADIILQKDRYKNLPSEIQLNLLKIGIAQDEKTEKKTEKITKDKSEIRYASILEDINKGLDMEQTIFSEGPNRGRILLLGEFEKALKVNEVTQKAIREGDWDSNPKIESDIEKKLYISEPTITEKEIWNMAGLGGISRKKAVKYSTDLRTRNDHFKSIERTEGTERRTEINRIYSQSEDYIRTGLGIYGMLGELLETLDPSQKKALAFAKEELWRRSLGGLGKENPALVATEILPRYKKMLHDEGLIEIDNIERGLLYIDADDLEKAFQIGKITQGTYDVQKKMFYERYRKIKLLDDISIDPVDKKNLEKKKGPYK